MNKNFVLVALLSYPLLAHAHPGHGFFDGISLAHFLTSPLHLITMVLIGVLFFSWRNWKRNQQRS